MSVTALVLGALSVPACCVVIGGPLAIIFGAISLYRVKTSNGRLRGAGMSIAGLVLGLLGSALSVGMIVGGVSVFRNFEQNFVQPTTTFMTAVEAKDWSGARGLLDPTVTIADDRLEAFRDAYVLEHGAFRGGPITQMTPGQAMGRNQPPPNMPPPPPGYIPLPLPIPFSFDNGAATMVLLLSDPNKMMTSLISQQSIAGHVHNVGIMGTSGSWVWLIDPAQMPPAPGGGFGGPPGGAPLPPPAPVVPAPPADPASPPPTTPPARGPA